MKTIAGVLLSFAALHALPAAAGTEVTTARGVALVPPAANMGAVVPSEQASTLRDPNKGAGKTLRCWQSGRLLYEDTGFKGEAERAGNTVVVPRAAGEPVTVFDNKDSVCILSDK